MPFTFKLSQRLARMWDRAPLLAAFLLPQLPQQLANSRHLFVGICLAAFVALRPGLAFTWLCLESGDRRHCRHIVLAGGRRLRDQHLCREFFAPGTRVALRIALLRVHKVP
jgi:hypothetical protein